ncbi:MAG: MarR family transcriptional regulator [Candidatus Omnitrophica bacterium]|nr:MarR family transcriptional regulator [Candidatus Omnitrophota bacterium]
MKTVPEIAEEVAMIGPRIGRKILADFLQVADIPHAQLFVIIMLFHNGACRACDIGRELKVAPPTATGIVDRLEKAGYVTRLVDKKDRRVVRVELTGDGRKIAKKLRTVVVTHWTEILSKISREDAEKYLEILKKISEVL